MSQLSTQLKKCKIRGDGSCPCVVKSLCVLVNMAQEKVWRMERRCTEAQRDLNDAMQELRHVTTPPAETISGWSLPDVPEGWQHVVHNEGESWAFGMEHEDGEYMDADELNWKYPFAGYSWSDDWERIGFEVV